MRLNHQSEISFENINQSDIILYVLKIIVILTCKQSLRQIITRYPASKAIKIAITWKPLFRRTSTFLSKLDLSSYYLTTFQIPITTLTLTKLMLDPTLIYSIQICFLDV